MLVVDASAVTELLLGRPAAEPIAYSSKTARRSARRTPDSRAASEHTGVEFVLAT